MEKEKMIHTKLAGVTKRNDEGEPIQSLLEDMDVCANEGDCLELEHESGNEYDDNAIKVFFQGDHIGYIKRELAAEIVDAVDEGKARAELDEITGGDDRSYGCNILVYISDDPYPPVPPMRKDLELDEALIESAKDYISSRETVSIRDLQMGLQIGYTKAAALIDKLEELGCVGPYAGAQPRQVLITATIEDPTAQELKIARAWAPLWVRIAFALLAIFSILMAIPAFKAGSPLFGGLLAIIAYCCFRGVIKSAKAAKTIKSQGIE